jgi:serine protease Do
MNNIENEKNNLDGNEKKSEKNINHKKFKFFLLTFLGVIFVSGISGVLFSFIFLKTLNIEKEQIQFFSDKEGRQEEIIKQKIVQEDSVIVDMIEKTAPSVVSIVISKDIPKIQTFRGMPYFFGDPFGFYFDSEDNGNYGETEKQKIGGGTGFFISEDGMIITNKHVVKDSSASYTVVTSDEKEYSAKILAVDPVNDIAVIKIEKNDCPVLSLGDSDSLKIGQTVVAIGNSLGEFSNTVSRGIISGLKRDLVASGRSLGQAERFSNIIQTDAAINPGNSGGPLLDINGEVVGINVAIIEGAQNIGFAIPSNQVRKTFNQVKETGKISTPFIGVRYIPVDEDLQKDNNLPYDYGCLVMRGTKPSELAVIPGSPADKAGISENDIILEINEEKINEFERGKSLTELILKYNVGDKVKVKIWHKGKEKNIELTLEERK